MSSYLDFWGIAQDARLWAKLYPDNAARYRSELESLNIFREGPGSELLPGIKHALNAWNECGIKYCQTLGDLATRVMAHLPDVAMQVPLLTLEIPDFRTMTDAQSAQLVKQLLLVRVEAVRRADSMKPDVVPVDPITKARDKWLIERWEKCDKTELIFQKLKRKPRSWNCPVGPSGVRSQIDSAYRRAGRTKPSRQRGRPAKK